MADGERGLFPPRRRKAAQLQASSLEDRARADPSAAVQCVADEEEGRLAHARVDGGAGDAPSVSAAFLPPGVELVVGRKRPRASDEGDPVSKRPKKEPSAAPKPRARKRPAAAAGPPPPTSLRLLFVDVGIKNFGWAVGRVERCSAAADDPLLGGFALRLETVDVMDALKEGAALELAAAGRCAEEVNANKLAIADMVRWTVTGAEARLRALLRPDRDGPPAVDAVVIEVQPMGGKGETLAAQKAMAARNIKTKALSHVLQAVAHMVDPRIAVQFASPHARTKMYAVQTKKHYDRKQASKAAAQRVAERSLELMPDADGATAAALALLKGKGKTDDMADAALGLFVHGRAALLEAAKKRRADAPLKDLLRRLPLREAFKEKAEGGRAVCAGVDPGGDELEALE